MHCCRRHHYSAMHISISENRYAEPVGVSCRCHRPLPIIDSRTFDDHLVWRGVVCVTLNANNANNANSDTIVSHNENAHTSLFHSEMLQVYQWTHIS